MRFRSNRLLLPTLLLGVLCVPAWAGSGRDFGRLNPQAPPETAQFAFLIGAWDCTTKFMKPDGSGYGEGKATWTGYFILDGYAIQDDWVSSAGGRTFRGTNIRNWNPKTGKWDNRWLGSGNLQWSFFEATQEGETMVMIGGEGTDARGDYIDRNVFHDITPDRWRWRKDRSYDGGKTWTEGVGTIEATRMGESPK